MLNKLRTFLPWKADAHRFNPLKSDHNPCRDGRMKRKIVDLLLEFNPRGRAHTAENISLNADQRPLPPFPYPSSPLISDSPTCVNTHKRPNVCLSAVKAWKEMDGWRVRGCLQWCDTTGSRELELSCVLIQFAPVTFKAWRSCHLCAALKGRLNQKNQKYIFPLWCVVIFICLDCFGASCQVLKLLALETSAFSWMQWNEMAGWLALQNIF